MSNSHSGRFCQPRLQELVDPAALAEHLLPSQDAGHERHDVGHEEERPEQALAPGVDAVQGQGQQERTITMNGSHRRANRA